MLFVCALHNILKYLMLLSITASKICHCILFLNAWLQVSKAFSVTWLFVAATRNFHVIAMCYPLAVHSSRRCSPVCILHFSSAFVFQFAIRSLNIEYVEIMPVAYAAKIFRGFKVMAGLVGGRRMFENLQKYLLRKLQKMHYFGLFFKENLKTHR